MIIVNQDKHPIRGYIILNRMLFLALPAICLAGRVNKAWYHLPGQSRVT